MLMPKRIKSISIIIAAGIILLMGVFSNTWFRFRLIDHYMNAKNYNGAIEVYRKILQKERAKGISKSVFFRIEKKNINKGEQPVTKIFNKIIQDKLKWATECYKQKRLKEALEKYDAAMRIFYQLQPVLKDNIFNLVNICEYEANPVGTNSIYILC